MAHYALDPEAPANQTIADLKLAPRDNRGKVVFDSEFILLRRGEDRALDVAL